MQDRNSEFHRTEYVKVGNTMGTARIDPKADAVKPDEKPVFLGKREAKGKAVRRNEVKEQARLPPHRV